MSIINRAKRIFIRSPEEQRQREQLQEKRRKLEDNYDKRVQERKKEITESTAPLNQKYERWRKYAKKDLNKQEQKELETYEESRQPKKTSKKRLPKGGLYKKEKNILAQAAKELTQKMKKTKKGKRKTPKRQKPVDFMQFI